jgi:hypothetical protein
MASKGTTEDGLPKRDREQGRRDIEDQRARDRQTERAARHETFEVPQRENQGHPDGFKNNR